eukprot:CAMPEP_0184323590 /NCGR_PEP_ID=MMETSP1049-20130417/131119_1 /TAXON_ID=77928 /ORGANISM="Proteomonas sulcata, Strain CCMP704" /LENGTH=83 /DNA_ID=CAMNT_0026645137 /DNA_START=526 /DNA_END=774 /DNA_ORIENTATION=+
MGSILDALVPKHILATKLERKLPLFFLGTARGVRDLLNPATVRLLPVSVVAPAFTKLPHDDPFNPFGNIFLHFDSALRQNYTP